MILKRGQFVHHDAVIREFNATEILQQPHQVITTYRVYVGIGTGSSGTVLGIPRDHGHPQVIKMRPVGYLVSPRHFGNTFGRDYQRLFDFEIPDEIGQGCQRGDGLP